MFGSRHPAVAAETNVLAVFLVEHGRNREAEACYRQSMEIWERTLGPYSPELASGLNNLAILLFMEDRPGYVFVVLTLSRFFFVFVFYSGVPVLFFVSICTGSTASAATCCAYVCTS